MYFSDLLLTVCNVTKYVKWAFKNHCSPLFALIDFRLKSFNHISYKRFPSILTSTIALKLEWLALYIQLRMRTQKHKSIQYLIYHQKEGGHE